MKQIKRIAVWALILTVLLGLCVSASAAPASSHIITTATGYTSADDVAYKTYTQSGKTVIANWGARGEVCVFLSTHAKNYYTGSHTWSEMSSLSGGTSTSSAPSSALYDALHDLMAGTHSFYTYYDGNKNVRDFYRYTDCVASDISQVSIIYRGNLVTSQWNGGNTWNQEHVWPKSKLSTDKQIGDIMHLRPSNPSENSNRGNKAYGESSGCYNPGVSVRGDCARMVLYMYVRWGVTSTMWGSSGVMESLDILLEWMEEDPVDTWEMGRNDAVQSITGVRNVFVDYPEYAWLLFGEEIPANMTTPSGGSSAGSSGGSTGGSSDPNHRHNYSENVTTVPTCTEDGVLTYSCYCGASYTESIEALGHSYNIVVTDPTCTEQGYTTYICDCGDSYNERYVAATGHSFGDWYEVTAATCAAEGQMRRDCANCDEYELQGADRLSHSYTSSVTAPTCTQQGYTTYTCTACGDSYASDHVAATGHNYGDWYEVTAATCAAEGQMRRDCANCQRAETKAVAAIAHTYTSVVTAPTCTEAGFTTYTCTACGGSYTADQVDPTGHSFGDWIIVPGGGARSRWCSVCSYEETEDLSSCQHSSTELFDAVAATCTEEGFTGRLYCSDCGKFIDMGEAIPATGHSDADLNWLCDVCNAGLCEHGESEVRDAHEPTCSTDGYTGDTYCINCGALITSGSVIPATGNHQFSEWELTEDGKANQRYCQVCELTEAEEITCTHENKVRRDEVEPTCNQVGFTGDVYCGDCGEFIAKGAVIAAVGEHKFTEWVTNNLTASRSCTVCGHRESVPVNNVDNGEDPEENRNSWVITASVIVIACSITASLIILKKKKQ